MENVEDILRKVEIKFKDMNDLEKKKESSNLSPEERIFNAGQKFREIQNQKKNMSEEKIKTIGNIYKNLINEKK